MTSLAPIVLFAHSRPLHTMRTLEALAVNHLAKGSNLFIYVDAAKEKEEEDNVHEVLRIARDQSNFRSLNVIQRERNYGLADNIIGGVSDVCNKYGRVIVLEDDMVTSPYFLQYMNDALDRYEHSTDVWHISGWNYPIDSDGLPDAYFWKVMNCWGWATWADRWQCFEKDPEKLLKTWDKSLIRRFNLGGAQNYWRDVKRNAAGSINTWAVFWYASLFEHGGLCLNPSKSLVNNIGLDGSGENCRNYDRYEVDVKSAKVIELPENIAESALAVEKIKKYFIDEKGSLLKRVSRFANRFAGAR